MKQVFRQNTKFRNFRVKLSPDAPVGSKVTVDGGVKYWIDDAERIIAVCQKIIDEYQAQSITMTLRQLYYQLVSADEIPNTDVAYKKVSEIVKEARYSGLLDWDAIEDRGRQPVTPLEFDSIKERIDLAVRNFRLPRWADQEYYLELFSEKDALSSVLMPIASQYHITYCFNKGYSSASAYYDLQNRVRDKLKAGKKVILLYLGDHDSSGVDMIRDIKDRITEFLTSGDEYIALDNFDVVPVALTWEQIKKYNPPPNPAKLTDPRAGKYIAKYGSTTWEVDALKPDVMIRIVDNAILKYIDVDKYNAVIEREDEEKQKLIEFAKKITPKKVLKGAKMKLGDDKSKIFILSQDISTYEYDKETADSSGCLEDSVDYFCPICGNYYENDACNGKKYALDNLWEHIKEHSQAEFDKWKKELEGDSDD
jgi:hypothetical protein